MLTVGKNISYQVKDDKLTIEVDLSKEFGRSRSGKTIIIASTEGNQNVNGSEVVMGVNVYKK